MKKDKHRIAHKNEAEIKNIINTLILADAIKGKESNIDDLVKRAKEIAKYSKKKLGKTFKTDPLPSNWNY